MVQGFHGVDFSERSLGTLLINDFDSHFFPGQNVLGQPHLSKAFLVSGVQELLVASWGSPSVEMAASLYDMVTH